MSKLVTPNIILEMIVNDGKQKSDFKFYEQILLGILGGIFIGLGAHGCITIMQNMNAENAGLLKFAGASIFSVGLILIILGGGQLFTGNTLLFLTVLEKKITKTTMLKNWFYIYFGNFIGSLILVGIIYYSGLYGHSDHLTLSGASAVKFAHKKVGLSFIEAFTRGILCNVLVAGAVWLMKGASTFTGKIAACWFPITCFVLSGFEHCVANMYYLPLGKMLDSSVSWQNIIISNLVPVTLGNIVGGIFIIGLGYYYSFNRKNKLEVDQNE